MRDSGHLPRDTRQVSGHGEVVLLERRLADGSHELTPMGNLKPGLGRLRSVGPSRESALVRFRIAYANELMRARYTTDWDTARAITARTEFVAWRAD
jgi:hypothetical protein